MKTEFDDKGKIYTDVVAKVPVVVILQTIHHKIRGRMHLRPTERLIDELNQGGKFIAITDACIYKLDDQEVYRTDFLTLNKDEIIWIVPEENMITSKQRAQEAS